MGCTLNSIWVLSRSANAFLCWHLSLKVDERFSSKRIATPQFYKIIGCPSMTVLVDGE